MFKPVRFVVLDVGQSKRITILDKKKRKLIRLSINSRLDVMTAAAIFCFEEYSISNLARENELQKIYSSYVDNNCVPLIIDCGSNIGLASVYFAYTYPKSTIIGYEPESKNFDVAKINSKMFSNIEIKNIAVGSHPGFVSISNTDADNNAFQTEMSQSGTIPMLAINSVLSSNNQFKLFIVKIDIEGFESELFSKNTEWIDRCDIIMIEIHDWMLPHKAISRNFLREISKRNRDLVIRGENLISIKNENNNV
jgi:FkbM family methyltransferase